MFHFEFKSHRQVASLLVFNTGPFVLHLTAGPFTSNFYVACEAKGQTRHMFCLCETPVTRLNVFFEYFVGLLSSFTRRKLSVWSTSTAASLSPSASFSVGGFLCGVVRALHCANLRPWMLVSFLSRSCCLLLRLSVLPLGNTFLNRNLLPILCVHSHWPYSHATTNFLSNVPSCADCATAFSLCLLCSPLQAEILLLFTLRSI